MNEVASAMRIRLCSAFVLVFLLLSCAAVPSGGASAADWGREAGAAYVYDGLAAITDRRESPGRSPDKPSSDSDHSSPVAEAFKYDDPVNLARASARLEGYRLAPRAISAGDAVASSAAQGARLREHLRLADEYGAGGVRELPDGRFRYYGELKPARKPGDMAGGRLVREWSPDTGNYRTWYETLDHSGRIRQVHPYQPRSPYHYWFDEQGKYGGRW